MDQVVMFYGENTPRLFNESALLDYFCKAGIQLEQEKKFLLSVIHAMASDKAPLTNKAIILFLLTELKSAQDSAQIELLRSVLNIIVSLTPDDLIL